MNIYNYIYYLFLLICINKELRRLVHDTGAHLIRGLHRALLPLEQTLPPMPRLCLKTHGDQKSLAKELNLLLRHRFPSISLGAAAHLGVRAGLQIRPSHLLSAAGQAEPRRGPSPARFACGEHIYRPQVHVPTTSAHDLTPQCHICATYLADPLLHQLRFRLPRNRSALPRDTCAEQLYPTIGRIGPMRKYASPASSAPLAKASETVFPPFCPVAKRPG